MRINVTSDGGSEGYFPPEAGWTRPDGGFYTDYAAGRVDTGGQSELFQQALRERVLTCRGTCAIRPTVRNRSSHRPFVWHMV